jgi:hypothetical protein
MSFAAAVGLRPGEQPGNAVPEPDNRQGSMAPLIFGAISAVVGAAILAFFIKVGFSN